ncbi:MAG: hypothetical protein O2930_12075, partial [Acidobacteria bacterium]|nr:hypothetical protein [Acidobacteriota bacterium]
CGPDFDFGQAPILSRAPDGRELLLIGQKSGIVWALDPTKEGEVVWQTRVGVGGLNGGVQWGMATEGQRVFATVSDVKRSRNTDPGDPRRVVLDPSVGGGLTALRIADGATEWYYPAAPCADGRPLGCSPSQPGAVTTIPGVVFTTSVDGYLRAHSTTDGALLWSFDTMRDFETVNGVAAHGGSIDGPGCGVPDQPLSDCGMGWLTNRRSSSIDPRNATRLTAVNATRGIPAGRQWPAAGWPYTGADLPRTLTSESLKDRNDEDSC